MHSGMPRARRLQALHAWRGVFVSSLARGDVCQQRGTYDRFVSDLCKRMSLPINRVYEDIRHGY